MGCVHGKCCSRYPSSSADSGDSPTTDPYKFQRKQALAERSLESVSVPSHEFRLEYSALTQRGYYPDSLDKENQDCYIVKTSIQGNPNVHFFAVFDGHGQFGTQCSNFARETVVAILSEDQNLLNDPIKAYESAFSIANAELHENPEIDDAMSGTTAITVLLVGKTLYVANVGDSRAVIAVRDGDRVAAEDLSNDQTPFRRDEYERVKLCGARVLSVDQVEGVKDPDIQSWGDEESDGNDPPRLWVPNGMYPGTAFTRSVGDSTAERIGVVADPEVAVVELSPEHLFFIVASDGVFEFLSSQAVVDMAAKYADPRDACAAIAGESYKLWLEHESRTDDITIIIVHLKGLNLGAGDTGGSIRIVRNGKEASEVSSVSVGSEVYRSVRSDVSELQTCQFHVSTMNRSPAIVVPSPTSPAPLQV